MNSKTIFSVLLFFSTPLSAATSYAPAFEQVAHGVVNIRTKGPQRQNSPKLDPYHFFLQGKPAPKAESYAMGSGVIMDQSGHILTNYHVVQDAKDIEILLANTKRTLKVALVGYDRKTDLAVLKANFNNVNFRSVDFGNSDLCKVGDVVLAIGNPFGYAHTVTSGIISAKGRVIGTGPYDNFIQTDAPIHPGNSGGPLVDTRGRVIAINTAVPDGIQGIGFAIPSNLARKIAAELIKHGQVQRPWLGVVGENLHSPGEYSQALTNGVHGVLIVNLVSGGPAHKAGLKIGDLITQIDKDLVQDLYHLHRLLAQKTPQESIKIKTYRRGKGPLTLNIQLDKTPPQSELPDSSEIF